METKGGIGQTGFIAALFGFGGTGTGARQGGIMLSMVVQYSAGGYSNWA